MIVFHDGIPLKVSILFQVCKALEPLVDLHVVILLSLGMPLVVISVVITLDYTPSCLKAPVHGFLYSEGT